MYFECMRAYFFKNRHARLNNYNGLMRLKASRSGSGQLRSLNSALQAHALKVGAKGGAELLPLALHLIAVALKG